MILFTERNRCIFNTHSQDSFVARWNKKSQNNSFDRKKKKRKELRKEGRKGGREGDKKFQSKKKSFNNVKK